MTTLNIKKHAKKRIYERTKLSCRDILKIIRNKEYIRFAHDNNKKNVIHSMIYDHKHNEFYVLVFDEVKQDLITILYGEELKSCMVAPIVFEALRNRDYKLEGEKNKIKKKPLKKEALINKVSTQYSISDLDYTLLGKKIHILDTSYHLLNGTNPKKVRQKIREHFKDITEDNVVTLADEFSCFLSLQLQKFLCVVLLPEFLVAVNHRILNEGIFKSQRAFYHDVLESIGYKRKDLVDILIDTFYDQHGELANELLLNIESQHIGCHCLSPNDILFSLALSGLGISSISGVNRVSANIQNNFLDDDFLSFTSRPKYKLEYKDFHGEYYSDEHFIYMIQKRKDFVIEFMFKDNQRISFGFNGIGNLDDISASPRCLEAIQKFIEIQNLDLSTIKSMYVYKILDRNTSNPRLRRRKVY